MLAGISDALYGGGAQQQAASTSKSKEEAAPAPSETTKETTTPPKTTAEATTEAATAPKSKAKTAASEPAVPAPSQPDEAEAKGEPEREYDATARVTQVTDGDTIKISPAVDGIDEVRLIGVDTAETKDPDCAVQPYGPEASR